MSITVKSLQSTQEANALPSVRGTAALTDEAAGASIAKPILSLGLQMYQDELHRQDQVAFLEADRKLSEWEQKRLYDPKAGALTVRGKDAMGLPDTVGKDYQATVDEVRKGLTTERQQVAFDRSVEARRKDINHTLSRHVFAEMRKYEDAETENYIKNSMQSAILNNGDPERVDLEIGRAVAATRDFAARNGLGAEYTKQKTAQIVSDTMVGVVDRFLSQGNDQMARKVFDAAKADNRITGDDIGKLEARLKVAITEGEGLRGAVSIWDKMGPKSDTDPVNIDKMEKEAESQFADNMGVLKHVKAVLTERANKHNAAQRERNESNMSVLWDAIDAGGTLASITTLPAWRNVTGAQRDHLTQTLRQRSEHNSDRAYMLRKRAEGEGDEALYYTRLTEASTTALQDGFLQRNLLDDRGKIAKTQWNHLVEVQASLRKGDTKNAEKLLASDRQQNRMVDEALIRMRLDPTPNEKTPKSKVEQIVGFRKAVREAVTAIEQRTGKNATDAEVQGIVDGFVIEAVTKPGVLWNDTKRIYQIEPGDQIIIKVTDVPKEERSKIEDALRRQGRAITDQAVVGLYTQKLYQMRRVPPPAASGATRK